MLEQGTLHPGGAPLLVANHLWVRVKEDNVLWIRNNLDMAYFYLFVWHIFIYFYIYSPCPRWAVFGNCRIPCPRMRVAVSVSPYPCFLVHEFRSLKDLFVSDLYISSALHTNSSLDLQVMYKSLTLRHIL